MNHFSSVPRFRVAFITVALLGMIAAAANSANAQRLPQTVRPERYTLTLIPDLKAATFTGDENIVVTLEEPTDHITLNAAEITFQAVFGFTGTALTGRPPWAKVTLDKEKQQATITFPHVLPAGEASLHIIYTSILNNELRGFYLSKTDKRNYAVTQFESTDARRAFPCFDEPAFKATYTISLIVDDGDTAISNSPIVTDTPTPSDMTLLGANGPINLTGKHTIKFATTPKMSTYLVAFLVGDFQCTSGESDGVAIRVCSTPDKVALTPYGLDVAKYMLHYYNNYFGIPYPLKKLDLIALPDFEAGAMENFGAITYRETDLLIDPQSASVYAKKEVAIVIAHEMAHQWFGDLVTMQWWDNIWLNEGFATWMENKAVAHMHPEWNIDQIVAEGVNESLNLDAQPTTRAIRATADTPDEINQMFDGIAYGKAGAVLSTVENYLGEETFRQGVHNYLSAHLYANATAEDFWNAQTAASHKPVDKIMGSLVAQPGAPILTFGQPSSGKLSVSQKRFYLSPKIHPDPAQKWTLPVCLKTGTDTQDCQVLTPASTSLKVPANDLFFANAGGRGYYRSAYAPSNYAALLAGVETTLTPAERISLIGDEWAQLRSNKATVGDYLNLAAAVKSDSNAEVIGVALSGVESIYGHIASTPEEKAAISAWIRATFEPQFTRLGDPSPTDSDNTRELRSLLFNFIGYYGNDHDVIVKARLIAQKYLLHPESVDPTTGQTAISIAARYGDPALFAQLQSVYETSKNPELQEGALRLLAEFQTPALVQRSLDYAVSGKVRNQDAAIQFAIAMQIDENRNQVWKFIQNNWDKVQKQLTTEMGAELVGSTGNFCTADARNEVKNFFSTHKVPSSDMSLLHAIEHINGCIELRALQEPNLKQWLATQPKP
jgi:aminopeptidase N/puromycin-sensitive aminopeptidase